MLRAVDRWLPGYVQSLLRRRPGGQRHLLLCVVDHFEPLNRSIGCDGSVSGGVPSAEAGPDVTSWCNAYRDLVAPFRDSDGRAPVHSFFYPWDEYAPECLSPLADLVGDGLAEIEVHLHHRNDTAEGLYRKLTEFRRLLAQTYGLLGRDEAGEPRFGFVHGNWALANARPDGDWCGVNDELSVLKSCGCYADFTFPSAPSATQPRVVNVPYLARDTGLPGSATRGRIIRAGQYPSGLGSAEGLPIIPGPLGLNWGWRKWGVLPRLENGELSGTNPPTLQRLACWQRLQVQLPGCPEWTLVKLHTHGWVGANREMLLGEPMRQFHRDLAEVVLQGACVLHYVSARELFNIVAAAAEGRRGDPAQYRDHVLAPPPRAR